jgi:Mg/Co/Ni transporter MgtE
VKKMIVSRGGWLSLFLISLSLTSVVMGGFEQTLAQQIELAYFVPLLIGHGGNAGGQTVGAVLSAMSSGEIGSHDCARVITKECLAGLGSGILTCFAVLPLLIGMKISTHVSIVVLSTLPILSVFASGVGATIPFVVSRFGADPAVIAAPAMTTFVDVGGLLAYFAIARAVFSFLGQEL